MAASNALLNSSVAVRQVSQVAWIRLFIVAVLLVSWQLLALSGLLYQDVVPTLQRIGLAFAALVTDGKFYTNLWVTMYEVTVALAIGGMAGLFVGIVLGGSRFLGQAFEPYVHYLGPTPKIIFLPIMIMWFGVGPGSKVAMGAFSCFFPVVLSVAVGMRAIPPILIRVGQSFRANRRKMVMKIYLPAMRAPVINGFRLGFGVSLIGVLLAETKLSNQGIGFQVIQYYQQFNMPAMYALLIAIFMLSIGANVALTYLTSSQSGLGKHA